MDHGIEVVRPGRGGTPGVTVAYHPLGGQFLADSLQIGLGHLPGHQGIGLEARLLMPQGSPETPDVALLHQAPDGGQHHLLLQTEAGRQVQEGAGFDLQVPLQDQDHLFFQVG